MKRRKFLKFLALIPALPIACQGGWPFKPKSKPPPIDRYDPDEPEIGMGNILFNIHPNDIPTYQMYGNRIWVSHEIPDGEVWFVDQKKHKLLGRIINIGG